MLANKTMKRVWRIWNTRKLISAGIACFASLLAVSSTYAEDGYDLWLRYVQVQDANQLAQYRENVTEIVVQGDSPTMQGLRVELKRGLSGLLGRDVPITNAVTRNGAVWVNVPDSSKDVSAIQGDGYILRSKIIDGKQITIIGARTELGALYGTFGLLRLMQTCQPIDQLNVMDNPKIRYRLLNHWDYLGSKKGGGYAGDSLWYSKWGELPDKIDQRFIDYARANASLGINGTVLNNVFGESVVLTTENLEKAAALAAIFRPYGVRVYLSANLAAPMAPALGATLKNAGIGDMDTADPLNPTVIKWWKTKVDEIYQLIPDFGGFLIKSGSEGMPSPKQYDRSYAETANMLASALAPHGGIVMWRAFVYDPAVDADRAKRAYKEFVPLDGKFAANVFVQVKNGPMDFQPREPVHPLWGAMPKTPLMMELEVKQEYLGDATDIVYEGEEWQEVLRSDTFAQGKGSTVARVVDGSLHGYSMTGIAGVANIGTDRNWCGHPFAAANWYAFGRLAWNPYLDADAIAEEWVRMTWGNNPLIVNTTREIMKGSWQAAIDVRSPLGLNFLCGGNHRDPNPQNRINDYFNADENGIGYNRTDHAEFGWLPPSGLADGHPGKARKRSTPKEGVLNLPGTASAGQYHEPLRTMFNEMDQCPENYMLWFHFVQWDHKMQSGRTLWEELCFRYDEGLEHARHLTVQWQTLAGQVDAERYAEVSHRLAEQEALAKKWRDTCVSFFAKKSGRSAPEFPPKRANSTQVAAPPASAGGQDVVPTN